ncbi:MAG: hypothetical protein ACRET8_04765, partial [Burkholderiales bacterium]
MIFRRFLIISVLLCAAPGALAAPKPKSKAPTQDEAFLTAHDAFRAGDAIKLQKLTPSFGGYLLAPYLDYWRLKLSLQDSAGSEVNAFLQQQQGSYLAQRLRIDWLKELGRRGDWQGFEQALPLLLHDDLEIRCYAWLSRLTRGDESANDEARSVWFEPRELPEGCGALVDKLVDARLISVDDVWKRARLLLQNGLLNPARKALAYLPAAEKYDESLFNRATTAPRKLLANPPRNLERRATREMMVFAVLRLARGGDP